MNGPCEHCGNADKSKWLSQCLYKGSFPSRRAFILSTFDAPCAGNAYDEGQIKLRQSRNKRFWKLMIASVALIILITIFIGKI